MMKTTTVLLLAVSCMLPGSTVICSLIPDRAPAPIEPTDCLCQCEGTTFLDIEGNLQGNCLAADDTGRKWCYINSDRNTMEACGDSFGYDDRYHMFKSYKACATPDPHSEECFFNFKK